METNVIEHTIEQEYENKSMSCCGKEWNYECVQSLMNINGITISACCKVCGHFITIVEDILDDEELDELNGSDGK